MEWNDPAEGHPCSGYRGNPANPATSSGQASRNRNPQEQGRKIELMCFAIAHSRILPEARETVGSGVHKPAAHHIMDIMDGTAKTRWFQIKLSNVFVATFWIAVTCGVATGMWRGQVEGPIWIFAALFALLAAFWSIQGRYWNVLTTLAFAALFYFSAAVLAR